MTPNPWSVWLLIKLNILEEIDPFYWCSYGDDCYDGMHYIDGHWINYNVAERRYRLAKRFR